MGNAKDRGEGGGTNGCLKRKQDNFRQIISDKSVVLLGTSWGTHCKFEEPFENLMGTHWKHEKKKHKIPPLPKTKNPEPLECMHVASPRWLSRISIPTFVCHDFFDIG